MDEKRVKLWGSTCDLEISAGASGKWSIEERWLGHLVRMALGFLVEVFQGYHTGRRRWDLRRDIPVWEHLGIAQGAGAKWLGRGRIDCGYSESLKKTEAVVAQLLEIQKEEWAPLVAFCPARRESLNPLKTPPSLW